MQSLNFIEFEEEFVTQNSGERKSLATLTSTMELFQISGNLRTGKLLIEWDIPCKSETEYINTWIRSGKITKYDGVFFLPKQAICLLKSFGISQLGIY